MPNVTIIPGVVIEDECVIETGSVVTKRVSKRTLVRHTCQRIKNFSNLSRVKNVSFKSCIFTLYEKQIFFSICLRPICVYAKCAFFATHIQQD